jgi:hypothetical protein
MTSIAYFANCHDVAAIKSEYKKLAMRWHPDRPGGNTTIMQEINAAYKVALSAQHGTESTDDQGATHTYYYKESTEQAIIDKITEVIKSGILSSNSVELWLIGVWLWVKGDTKPHRQKLGRDGLGFQWNQTRQCWQWHLPTKYRTNASTHGFEVLAAKYGAAHIAQPQEATIQ